MREFGAPYGRDLAEQGVVTLCPDNAGMGERAHPSGGCDFLWRRLNYLGYDLTGYRVYDLMRVWTTSKACPKWMRIESELQVYPAGAGLASSTPH